MKTKSNFYKTTTVIAIALMFGFTANAQVSNTTPSNGDSKTKTTQLSVQVGEFYSLNLSSDNATISLDTEAKFASGSESTPITMTIFSSKNIRLLLKFQAKFLTESLKIKLLTPTTLI